MCVCICACVSYNAFSGVVAPFSSGDKSLKGVLRLLAEGRCALATNFAAFKCAPSKCNYWIL